MSETFVGYELDENGAMSPTDVARVAHAAGFRGEALWIIVAIGSRESGWRPAAHRTDYDRDYVGGDRGLFQINHGAWDDRLVEVGIISANTVEGRQELFDPLVNARAAFFIAEQGSNFDAWSAAKNPATGKTEWTPVSEGGKPLHGVRQSNIDRAGQAIFDAGFGSELPNWSPGDRPQIAGLEPSPLPTPEQTVTEAVEQIDGIDLYEPSQDMPYSAVLLSDVRAAILGSEPDSVGTGSGRAEAPPPRSASEPMGQPAAPAPPRSAVEPMGQPAAPTGERPIDTAAPEDGTGAPANPYQIPPSFTGFLINNLEPWARNAIRTGNTAGLTARQVQSVNRIRVVMGNFPYAADNINSLEFARAWNGGSANLERLTFMANQERLNFEPDFDVPPMQPVGTAPAGAQPAPTTTTPTTTPSGATPPTLPDLTNIPGVDTFDPTQGIPQSEVNLVQGISTVTGEAPTPQQAYEGITSPGTATFTPTPSIDTGPTLPGEIPDPTRVVTEDWEKAIAELYPAYYGIIQNNPEIKALIEESLGPPRWSEQKFQAALYNTNWWQTSSESARLWELLKGQDPAEANRRVEEQIASITASVNFYGVSLTETQVRQLAEDSLQFGFSPQEISNAIGMKAIEGGPEGMSSLTEGYYGQEMRRRLSNYGVTLSDTTFNRYLNEIAVGSKSLDSFQDYALSLAKTLYPALADRFDAGDTFDNLVDPYRQQASRILEIEDNSIDFTDPQWQQAVTYVDPGSNEQRLMSTREWGDYLRKTPSFGYEYTTGAKEKAYQTANRLADMFGKV